MGASTTRQADGAAASAKFRFLLTHRRRAQGFRESLGAEADEATSLTMLWMPPGRFWMGSPEDEPQEPVRITAEGPQHLVQLQGFFLAQTPITQAQWRQVADWQPNKGEQAWSKKLNPNPSRFKGDQRPVEWVSWEDAIEFCHRLSQRTGRHYTLPSEAQWEYACRAGTSTPFHWGATISRKLANYDGRTVYGDGDGEKGDYRQLTMDVASFPANPWGLHDMHGNVWEWCTDHWHGNYEGAPEDGRAWNDEDAKENKNEMNRRLLRGGSWGNGPANCRSAYRDFDHPDDRNGSIGFRVCCLPQD
jgi:formylglycine-generating enzyme required for sulfatase activity